MIKTYLFVVVSPRVPPVFAKPRVKSASQRAIQQPSTEEYPYLKPINHQKAAGLIIPPLPHTSPFAKQAGKLGDEYPGGVQTAATSSAPQRSGILR
ncbi:hypothetical protein MY11210_003466 [Beauveria gryllotalpidicola]